MIDSLLDTLDIGLTQNEVLDSIHTLHVGTGLAEIHYYARLCVSSIL